MHLLPLKFDLSGGEFQAVLAGLEARLAGLSGPLDAFGGSMMDSVARNFAQGGRPIKWRPLSESTVRRKRSDRVLVDTGALMHSIGFTADGDRLVIKADTPYAEVHQHGGKAGSGGSVNLPARPFIVFQAEDIARLEALIAAHLLH